MQQFACSLLMILLQNSFVDLLSFLFLKLFKGTEIDLAS